MTIPTLLNATCVAIKTANYTLTSTSSSILESCSYGIPSRHLSSGLLRCLIFSAVVAGILFILWILRSLVRSCARDNARYYGELRSYELFETVEERYFLANRKSDDKREWVDVKDAEKRYVSIDWTEDWQAMRRTMTVVENLENVPDYNHGKWNKFTGSTTPQRCTGSNFTRAPHPAIFSNATPPESPAVVQPSVPAPTHQPATTQRIDPLVPPLEDAHPAPTYQPIVAERMTEPFPRLEDSSPTPTNRPAPASLYQCAVAHRMTEPFPPLEDSSLAPTYQPAITQIIAPLVPPQDAPPAYQR